MKVYLALAATLLILAFTANTTHAQEIYSDAELYELAREALTDEQYFTAALYLFAYVQRNNQLIRTNGIHRGEVLDILEKSFERAQSQLDAANNGEESPLVFSGVMGFQPFDSLPDLFDDTLELDPYPGQETQSRNIPNTGAAVEATILFDGDPNSNRRKVNATFCSGFDSECDFGNCPNNYKLVWGPYCRASDYAYIQPGSYRVTLSGTGTVLAGATDYGTFFNLYGLGRHNITLPGSYTFCWPGRAPEGYGFETIVQAQSTSDRITNIRIEYLGPCQ